MASTVTGPYCPDLQCIEDDCTRTDPCCAAICSCPLTENCTVIDTGDVFTDFDGTVRDVLYCTEHRNDWLK